MDIESETIMQLANQLGLATERVFEIFVTAQPIIGIISAILLLTVIVAVGLVYKYVCKLTEDNTDKWEIRILTSSISGLGFMVLALFIYIIYYYL